MRGDHWSLASAGNILAVRPDPVADLRHVFAVLPDITRMLDQGVAKLLFDMRRGDASSGHPLDDLNRQMESIEFVQDDHIERRRRRALFRKATDMHPGMIGAVICQAMDEVGIAMIG